MTMAPLAGRDAEAATIDRWAPGVRVAGRTIALILGALQAWAGRFPIGEDGLSYLDLADAYIRGDWRNAVSAYWSPLYSWVLASGLALTRPSPFMESTVVHVINFLIYACALASFEFFVRQLLVIHGQRERAAALQGETRLPASAILALAYGLFIWASLQWITVSLESPDMTLTILVYLAAGLLLRMRTLQPTVRTFVGYGIVLGFAYLTKAAMFPLSLVFLALVFLTVKDKTVVWRGVAVAAVAFAIVASPYIAAISLTKERLTLGDTGKLAYIWHANEATDRERHWHAEFPDDRRPVHPTRKMLDAPALYEFGSDPVGGAYPVWYDPSYWHDGVKVRFDLRGQLRTLRWSAAVWRRLLVTDGDFLAFGALILFAVGFRRWNVLWRELTENVELLIPFIAALGLYSVVLLSPRYVAVFAVLFWMGIFASVRLPQSSGTRRLAWAVPIAILLMIGLRLAPWSIERLQEAGQQRDPQSHTFWQVAEGLRQLGANPGDQVAIIGYGAPAYWARLARLRIVAEMFSEDLWFPLVPGVEKMLQPDGSLKPAVIEALSRTGARFVVARQVPANVVQHGWKQLAANTTWYAYPLPR